MQISKELIEATEDYGRLLIKILDLYNKKNVPSHVCSPTLLLTEDQFESLTMEVDPKGIFTFSSIIENNTLIILSRYTRSNLGYIYRLEMPLGGYSIEVKL